MIRWGNQSSITEGGLNPEVSLFVPGTTPKDAADYTTSLSWILLDLPTNS